MKKMLFILLSLLSVSTFAQDYWSKVPAFTTLCYGDKDPLLQKIDALNSELEAKSEEETNKTKAKFENMTDAEKQKFAMDMMNKQMNMTPAEIIEMQERMTNSAKVQQEAAEAGTAVTNRYNELEAAYREERKRDLDPLTAEALKLPDGEGTPDWAIKKAEELSRQYNEKYKAICTKYFTGPDALFKKWLADYKQYVIDYTIPLYKSSYTQQMQQYGIPNAESPTSEIQGVLEYLNYYRSAFQLRDQHAQGE